MRLMGFRFIFLTTAPTSRQLSDNEQHSRPEHLTSGLATIQPELQCLRSGHELTA